jgi:NAD(P)-dependent dehydrogenase (short-subunit alcohol dehydrogenase family)
MPQRTISHHRSKRRHRGRSRPEPGEGRRADRRRRAFPEKTAAVAAELGADCFVCDFAELAQVRELATALRERYPRIDVLVNNAGGIMRGHELTVDGHEKTFQVNHLAPFLLTSELLGILTASRTTIINTSSAANGFGRLDLADLNSERSYSTNRAYGTAKLANILFTAELQNRYGKDGIAAAAFHPGVVATNFAAESTSWFRHAYKTVFKPVPDLGRAGR